MRVSTRQSRACATEGDLKFVLEDRQPLRPIDAYKAMIDQLVNETSHGLSERLVLEEGVWTKAPDEEPVNAFVRSLSSEQRQMLARMLRDERTGTIHDVLALLTWWLLARGVGLTFRGEPMPVELSGQGLHGDYIARLDNWPWPKGDDPNAL
jgi:hypothetical protein